MLKQLPVIKWLIKEMNNNYLVCMVKEIYTICKKEKIIVTLSDKTKLWEYMGKHHLPLASQRHFNGPNMQEFI